MSHYTTLRTRMTDQATLVRALAAVGFGNVEAHQSPVPLIGYLGDTRAQSADVVIRRRFIGRASNDVGFVRDANGEYQSVVSEYDRAKFGPRWVEGVSRAYGAAAAERIIVDGGYECAAQEKDADGTIRMLLRRWA